MCDVIINIRYENTPIIVVRIVNDIDDIVKIVSFDGWQDTTEGKGCKEISSSGDLEEVWY